MRDFVAHLRLRFSVLSRILRDRPELANTTAIVRVQDIEDNVTLIGLIKEKRETKNKNIPKGLQKAALYL